MAKSSSTTTPQKPFLNLDPLFLKTPSYTSLKDVLPFSAAACNSPAASHHQYVSIRNRLVKQAAWAYLQPMSISPSGPSGPHFFRHFYNRFSSPTHNNNPLTTCLSFIYRTLHRILHAIPCFLHGLVCLR
ncbi:hypothetical protein JHK85_027874 [Glycine max]|nr:hypothetical protein JHK85_027874 [Glycine max]KAG5003231.1 hypothetical protein JHK86_027370 [Glycine max]